MARRGAGMRGALLLSAALARAEGDSEVCTQAAAAFTDPPAAALACYAGTFLTTMLGELNRSPALGWSRKTQRHVRYHLLPYLGGADVITGLRTATGTSDGCRDANCTTCLGNFPNASIKDMADGLEYVRGTVPQAQLQMYDNIGACANRLTDAVMDRLPKSDDGVWLVPTSQPPAQQVIALFTDLYAHHSSAPFTGCAEPAKVPAQPGDNCDGGAGRWPWVGACVDAADQLFPDKDEAAVYCTVASFLQWMLYELTGCPALGCCRKTEQHVRTHLEPFLGGMATSKAIATDDPQDANCTVCYQDAICSEHQQTWYSGPNPGDDAVYFNNSVQRFFALDVCYVRMTNYILEALPKDASGRWLIPAPYPEDPWSLTVKIMQGIFQQYGARACGGSPPPAPTPPAPPAPTPPAPPAPTPAGCSACVDGAVCCDPTTSQVCPGQKACCDCGTKACVCP